MRERKTQGWEREERRKVVCCFLFVVFSFSCKISPFSISLIPSASMQPINATSRRTWDKDEFEKRAKERVQQVAEEEGEVSFFFPSLLVVVALLFSLSLSCILPFPSFPLLLLFSCSYFLSSLHREIMRHTFHASFSLPSLSFSHLSFLCSSLTSVFPLPATQNFYNTKRKKASQKSEDRRILRARC